MRKLTLALSTAALGLAGAAAFAQAEPAPAPAPARAPQGDMTRAQVQARAEAAFARMDANRDGTLNEADRAARQAALFDRIDADRNGAISRAEFDAMHADRGDKGAMAGHRMGRAGADGHRAMMGGKAARADRPATRQAFVERALAMFDRADTNRDGTVTQAERKAARDSMRQQWQDRRPARQQG